MNRLLADYVHRTTHSDYDWLHKGRSLYFCPARIHHTQCLHTSRTRLGHICHVLHRHTRFSRVAKYLVLAGVVAGLLWVVCNVVVVGP
jgi:hypothetical protein